MENVEKISLLQSLGLHGGLVLALILFQTNLFSLSSPTNLEYLKTAVKVDIVAMPKQTLKELRSLETSPPLPAEETVAKENAPQEESVAKETFLQAQKKNNFRDRLKKLSQRKVLKNKKNKVDKKTGQQDFSEVIAAGNQLSEGSSLTGSSTAKTQSAFEEYGQEVIGSIRPYWRLPSYLIDQELQCRVQIFINAQGEMIRQSILQSSGNEEYDKRAMETLRQATPFPPPPESLINRLQRGDLVVGFPL